jgi:hypothetical protein
MARKNIVEHDFYCLNCGKRALTLPRKQGHQHERFHRKKLYCPWCQMKVNAIECKTWEDRIEFQENFEKGIYKEEAAASIEYALNERKYD